MAEETARLFDLRKFQVVEQAFPHAVADDFFEPSFFADLVEQFPGDDFYRRINHEGGRADLQKGQEAFTDFLSQSPAWSALYRFVNSPSFVRDALETLAPQLTSFGARRVRPEQVHLVEYADSRLRQTSLWDRGLSKAFRSFRREGWYRMNIARPFSEWRDPDAYYTSFHIGKTVNGYRVAPHTDNRNKLVVFLVYFDELPEGALQLHRLKDGRPLRDSRRYPGREEIEPFRCISSKPNRAVMMLNTNNAYHSAEPWGDNRIRRLIYMSVAKRFTENAWDTSYHTICDEPVPPGHGG